VVAALSWVVDVDVDVLFTDLLLDYESHHGVDIGLSRTVLLYMKSAT
jgi:hypothetical protein